jgi:hypothetical protein
MSPAGKVRSEQCCFNQRGTPGVWMIILFIVHDTIIGYGGGMVESGHIRLSNPMFPTK